MPTRYKKRTRTEIRRLLTLQQTSGLSAAAFCEQHTISPSTFYKWQRKHTVDTQKKSVSSSSPARFVQIPSAPIKSQKSEQVCVTGFHIRLPRCEIVPLLQALICTSGGCDE